MAGPTRPRLIGAMMTLALVHQAAAARASLWAD